MNMEDAVREADRTTAKRPTVGTAGNEHGGVQTRSKTASSKGRISDSEEASAGATGTTEATTSGTSTNTWSAGTAMTLGTSNSTGGAGTDRATQSSGTVRPGHANELPAMTEKVQNASVGGNGNPGAYSREHRRLAARKRMRELELALIAARQDAELSSDDYSDGELEVTLVQQQPRRPPPVHALSQRECERSHHRTGERKRDKPPHATETSQPHDDLTAALIDVLKSFKGEPQMAAPPKYLSELPCFDGDAAEWIPFKTVYRDTARYFSDIQNMARLRKALKGEARDTVKGLMYSNADTQEVIEALESRFGKPEVIILNELEQVKKLPRLQEDGRNLNTFASRVANCVATIKALDQPQYLYATEITSKIVEKLNIYMRFEWSKYCTRYPREPELQRMGRFLKEMSIQCSSIVTPEARKEEKKEKTKHVKSEFKRRPVHVACDHNSSHSEDGSEPEAEEENPTHHAVTVVSSAKKPQPEERKNTCQLCRKDHLLRDCDKFKGLSINERWERAKEARICFRCLASSHRRYSCRAKACGKNGCKMGHHRLLHQDREEKEAQEPDTTRVSSVNTLSGSSRTYLKIVPIELHGPRGIKEAYALLDEGSTVTLVEEDTALAVLPPGKQEVLRLEGIGGKPLDYERSFLFQIKIRGKFQRNFEEMRGQTIDRLNLMPQEVENAVVRRCPHLQELEDQLCYEKHRPTVLIGQDNWHLIVSRDIIQGKKGEPIASYTSLGWTLHGQLQGTPRTVAIVNHIVRATQEEDLHKKMKEHFSLESLGIEARKTKNDPEERALQTLEKTCQRLPNGRFEVGLLWKTDQEEMPESRRQAEKRLLNLEKKLLKDQKAKEEYKTQVNNLLEKGYAEKANEEATSPRTWYLPHFAVRHPQKGKIRMVFDAAARSRGRSLNDALLPGPDLLQTLFGVLLRFREGPIAVIADIKEMFLQVKMRTEDRDSLRFLWRNDEREPIEEYRMTSLIFGAASSPCSAIYAKNKNAEDFKDIYPETAKAVERNFYMDDYLQAFHTESEAKKTMEEMKIIHQAARFELRSWASNMPTLVEEHDDAANRTAATLGDHQERTLGLFWHIEQDAFSFALNLRNTPMEAIQGHRPPTKREVTSAVMSIFDPLGLASPIIIQGKHLIQKIWRRGTEWDQEIEAEEHEAWKEWLKDLKQLEHLKIPRNVLQKPTKGELHCFCDASETAYAASVYLLTEPKQAVLLAAKTRVAPLKPISIPRLELQAAVLGCRLTHSVKKELNTEIQSTIYWTDSRTVLQWIRSDPRTYKPFVAHRLAEIEEHSSQKEWRWVPTKENVADDATRGAPADFHERHRWFHGPQFLLKNPEEWPREKEKEKGTTSEEKLPKGEKCATLRKTSSQPMPEPTRFSSYTRLLRATARLLCCVETFKTRRPTEIEARHLHNAEMLLIQRAQREDFAEDIKRTRAGCPPMKGSKLKHICAEIDDVGILRATGRLDRYQGDLNPEAKHPIILDASNYFTKLLIHHYHRQCFHGNHETVINELRQRYLIFGLRDAVRTIIYRCQLCRIRKQKPTKPYEGELPPERLSSFKPPFNCSAIDYFGPMTVTIGRRTEKRWGVLITCLTTRAIHLELAASLTPSSAILALRRFIARRGTPSVMFSDNGTNFAKANKELREAAEEVKNYATSRKIVWKFIPPGAPHMGGAWERMIRTVKNALHITLKEKAPKEETLHTLMLEIEHIVNSRPLTPVEPDLNREALTPNHFLIGRTSGATPIGTFDTSEANNKSWRHSQQLADQFWRRWTREYLPLLLTRQPSAATRHLEPKVGDVVLIADGLLPRGLWPRGEVIKLLPGNDGRTRVTEVRTNTGILRRPTSRLIVLTRPSSQDEVVEQKTVLPHKGEDVDDDQHVAI